MKFKFNCFSSGIVLEKEDMEVFPSTQVEAMEVPVLRGVVWIQRERLFSRWKERFCILTKDYLQCFRKGSTKLTEMGAFLFKV